MVDCKEEVGFSLMRDELIVLIFGLAVQAHFAIVLYTHSDNAQLSKSRGGGQPDGNIQLGRVGGAS